MAKIENETTLYKQNMEAIQSKLIECGFPADEKIPVWAMPDALDAALGLHEVFVCAKNDTLYTLEQIQKMTARQIAAAIPSVRGIVLSAEGHRFLIAPTDAYLPDDDGNENFRHYWGGYSFDTSMLNVSNTLGVAEQAAKTAAILDFDGYAKTQVMKTELEDAQIVAPASGNADETATQIGSAAYRAVAAYETNTKISGGEKGWYLPAIGELALIFRHLAAVHALMDAFNNRIGIGMFERFPAEYYWSSSEYNSTGAWGVPFGSGYMSNNHKFLAYRVRAVAAFH